MLLLLIVIIVISVSFFDQQTGTLLQISLYFCLIQTDEFMMPMPIQVEQSTHSLSNLSSIIAKLLRWTKVSEVKLVEGSNLVQKMRRLGQAFSDYRYNLNPRWDTVAITNSHIFYTASCTYNSLTSGTECKTFNNLISMPMINKPQTLAHKSNKSLILDLIITQIIDVYGSI